MTAGGGSFAGNGFSQGSGYRGRHGGYARSGYGYPAFAFGAGYDDGYYGDDAAWDYRAGYYDQSYAFAPSDGSSDCARRFKSYDPGSGTYLGHDGRRHSCP